MGGGDLALGILEDHRAGAVEHSQGAAVEARRVLAQTPAAAAGLDADQAHPRVFQEGGEEADRVAAAADAGDREVRRVGPRLALELELRLVADHPVEVAHHPRVGIGAEHRP